MSVVIPISGVARRCLAIVALSALAASACSHDPERAKVEYLQSGNRFLEQKKYPEAAVQYRNALQQDPK